ncbi:hypothetical protein M1N12_00695 [Peptococcaceae bacterium]|nr:hypothetical protein [Peptococcaceae bacterium]
MNNTNDLKEMLFLISGKYADLIIYASDLDRIIEYLDESIEIYHPVDWFNKYENIRYGLKEIEEIINSLVRMLIILAKGKRIEKPFLYIRTVLESVKEESKGMNKCKKLIAKIEEETKASKKTIKEAIRRFEQQKRTVEAEHTTADTEENKQVLDIYKHFREALEALDETLS